MNYKHRVHTQSKNVKQKGFQITNQPFDSRNRIVGRIKMRERKFSGVIDQYTVNPTTNSEQCVFGCNVQIDDVLRKTTCIQLTADNV